jgi:hypothetical protein
VNTSEKLSMTAMSMMKYISDEFDEVLARNGWEINSY